jgi:nucleoid-associated protein EbfC
MNPFDLLKNFNLEDLKKKSLEMMADLKEITTIGESGGGFVKVKINGEFVVLSIEFENNELLKDDLSTFRDLIISAHNNAVVKMRDELQKKFASNIIPGIL